MQVPAPAPAVVRCACYTRKSTNEGLDSDFSSIDNQREACEAFVKSQRSEGWVLVEERFDDGGFSGGTIERPALKRLLTYIETGEIGCVVVYKIDRLSRSLLDFVRLLELFEKQRVAFVAVTQQINTATSAGRLMLNVLMSFAQFERELGSERTREKIHAARKKGRYTGGRPPLGYDVDKANHRLLVNPDEAAMVRELFALYLTHRSLLNVVKEVNTRGWRRKSWTTTAGVRYTGCRFDKVYVQRILTNPLYIGQVRLKGEVYSGLHDAVIDEESFRQVGALLVNNRNGGDVLVRNVHAALLKGLLRCGRCGAIMAHNWTRKKNKVYRYYGCSTAQKQARAACPTPSLSAGEIEDAVVVEIRRLAQDPALVDQVFAAATDLAHGERRRLESERTRLLRQRQQREEAIQRLVSALESRAGELPEVVAERIEERQSEVAQLNERLAVVEQDLASVHARDISREHLTQTLAQFTELWSVLYPRERVTLVHSLIDSVAYHDETKRIEIRFRLTGDTRQASLVPGSDESA